MRHPAQQLLLLTVLCVWQAWDGRVGDWAGRSTSSLWRSLLGHPTPCSATPRCCELHQWAHTESNSCKGAALWLAVYVCKLLLPECKHQAVCSVSSGGSRAAAPCLGTWTQGC